ncbi:MAG: hypothetical protein K0R57_1136 [Paenibacillaceae bacterium]|nr:hypothetical protein [Paenibacillaceae bacterium]
MINDIVRYYRLNLTSYSLVFKYMKAVHFITSILIINFPFALSSLLLIPYYLFRDGGIWLILYGIGSIILFISFMAYFVRRAKRVLKRKYSIRSKHKGWRTKEFEDMRVELMIDYLEKNDLDSVKQVIHIKELLQKKLDREKIPSFIVPGVVLAFTVPVWVEYVKFTYSKTILSQSDAILFGVSCCAVIVILIAFINLGRFFFKEMREIFSMSDPVVTKALISFLDEVQLKLPCKESVK